MHERSAPAGFGGDTYRRCHDCGGCTGCDQPRCVPCGCGDGGRGNPVCDAGGASGHAGDRWVWRAGGAIAAQSCGTHFHRVLKAARRLGATGSAERCPAGASAWRGAVEPVGAGAPPHDGGHAARVARAGLAPWRSDGVRLSEEQRAVAEAPRGDRILVAAVPGSGKTATVVERIAHLVGSGACDAREIVAVSFTREAAGEVRERVTHRLGGRGGGVHINTFHSFCAALLREGGRAIGIEPGFAVGRSRELNRLIGGAIGRVRGAPPSLGPRDALRAVERHDRLSGDDAADIEPWEAELAEEYRSAQRREGELDFDGLVAEARRLLTEHPEALDAFIARGGQGLRLKHLLIDEFQDTNRVQYDVARLLAAGGAGVTAVGDPDQSIYSFRGGDAGNSARFLADFGGAREMNLTRTYRSTRRILGAARGVLGAGRAADGAPVSTGKAAGDAVTIWECADEREEGRLVAAAITAAMQADGRSYGDFAVLYRTGAQAAAAEAALAQAGIPARIVRRSDREGRREVTYFERSDVGEALALLRLAAKPNDAEALRAALPVAGSAADRACTAIAARARKDGVSLVVAASRVGSSRGQPARAAAGVSAAAAAGLAALDGAASDRRRVPDDPLAVTPYEGDEEMRGLMGSEAAEAGGGTAPPSAVLREVLGAGGAKHWLGATAQPDSREVLGQLVRRAAAFDTTPGRAGVLAFLGECDALRGAARGDADAPSAVSLMTIHSAKGLEFPVAFIVGMEEELLPGYRKAASELIEERRVCYVAMTRAIDRLYLTWARERTDARRGERRRHSASRFLADIPESVAMRYLAETAIGRGEEQA